MRGPGGADVGFAVGVLGVTSGCGAPFLHSPLVGADPALDPGLAGEWAASEPVALRAIVRTREGEPGSYTGHLIATSESGETAADVTVDIQLAEIGGGLYADLFLARSDRDRLVESYGFLAVPVHQVVRLEREGDALTARAIQGDWLEGHAVSGVVHERVAVGGGDVVLITASPGRARRLIERHADEPGALGQPIVFQRVND